MRCSDCRDGGAGPIAVTEVLSLAHPVEPASLVCLRDLSVYNLRLLFVRVIR
jgi:hypothetical protein